MIFTTEKAYAKLNISLDITGKLPDGFHKMCMVMQTCTLCDELTIRLTDGEFLCRSNIPYLPSDGRNLCVRAAQLFMDSAGISGQGVRIDMLKRIPVCAGLGGGSADSAAVLRALNRLTGVGFSQKELEELSRPLGSDVPFCVAGGTVLAREKGDSLTRLAPMPDCHIVICKPAFSISTPELFSLVDLSQLKLSPDTAGILSALDDGDLTGIARRMFNVFEDILPRRYGEVFTIKRRLLEHGAIGAVMTGTGSAVFGLFSSGDSARDAFEGLSADYKSCFICETKNV